MHKNYSIPNLTRNLQYKFLRIMSLFLHFELFLLIHACRRKKSCYGAQFASFNFLKLFLTHFISRERGEKTRF
jgi:hypothetical protein